MSVPGPPPGSTRPPRVVVFRANSLDADSRAKKVSLSLARLGYEVFALSGQDPDSDLAARTLGEPGGPQVSVVPVPIGTRHRDVHRHRVAARRRRQVNVIDWTPKDEYVTQVRELRRQVRDARGDIDRDQPVRSAPALARYAGARGRLGVRRLRWRAQWAVNVSHRLAWRRWDGLRSQRSVLATTRGTLPEVEDFADAFAPVLDELAPDIIHVHHPLVLGTAIRAARRRRAAGERCFVVYDAREDFLGIPKQEQGHWRRHSALVREEARYIASADAVVTVSEPITLTLAERYHLDRPVALVLNVPVIDPRTRPGRSAAPTVRQAAGLAEGVPLLVYGGAVSRARGIDVLIDALAHLPGVHAAVVAVPHPHPHAPDLIARAVGLGVADRLHFCPPVDQDHLLHYLSGADVAVMPLRTGSANIEQALPNKLFENLHAGLTMVTSDAALMAAFVREHDLGEVFSFAGDADGHGDISATNLAQAARRALDNPRDAASAHWEDLRRTYSWQGQEPALREVYAALIRPPRPDGIDEEHFASLTLYPGSPRPVGIAATAPAPGGQHVAQHESTVAPDTFGARLEGADQPIEERST